MNKQSPIPDWPASKIEQRATADLVPYARNARIHSDEQVDQIVKAIEKWGWTIPILVGEDNGVIAGHGRLLAAERMGVATVPVMVARGWTDDMRRAYVIADNQIAENSEWNPTIFAEELAELALKDFDLKLIGFDPESLASLSDFRPTLDPGAQHQSVTAEDMREAKEALDSRFKDASVQNLVQVHCPHCDEQFTINKDAL